MCPFFASLSPLFFWGTKGEEKRGGGAAAATAQNFQSKNRLMPKSSLVWKIERTLGGKGSRGRGRGRVRGKKYRKERGEKRRRRRKLQPCFYICRPKFGEKTKKNLSHPSKESAYFLTQLLFAYLYAVFFVVALVRFSLLSVYTRTVFFLHPR